MLRWFLAMVLSVTVLQVVAMGQSQEPPKQTPEIKIEQKADGAAKSKGETGAQTKAAKPIAPIEDHQAAEHPERHTDNEAEKRADEASEYGVFFGRRLKITDALLALFTLFLVVVGIGQGIFLYRTDQGTHKAAEAAKEAADVARDSLIYTQRAYVRLVNFPWLWRPDLDRPGKYLYDITPIVENSGNTQTIDARINVDYALRDDLLPEPFNFSFKGTEGFTLISAHQTVGASNAIILDDDLLAVRNGKKFFYIWGTIKYRDVFPGTPEHTTEFCGQISRVMGDALDPREPGNPKGTTVEIHFRIYPEHNKAN
jgi:hypothetical protein